MHIDTVAWFGSVLVVVSLMQRDALRLHAVNVVASAVFIVYDVALSLHPMTVLNTFLALVSVGQIVRLRRRRRLDDRWWGPSVPPTPASIVDRRVFPVGQPPQFVPDPTAAVRR